MVAKCVADAKVIDICEFGDNRILEETAKVYKKEKEMKKGMWNICLYKIVSFLSTTVLENMKFCSTTLIYILLFIDTFESSQWCFLQSSLKYYMRTQFPEGYWFSLSISHTIWKELCNLLVSVICSVGIAFPTCISVNNCVCHYSPLKTEANITLQDGDLVKM